MNYNFNKIYCVFKSFIFTLFFLISIDSFTLSHFRPITVMIDFSDYSHTEIKSRESNLTYSNSLYNKDFYKNMFFKDSKYSPFEGIEHMSVKQYYNYESGGSFKLIGEKSDIFGWYTAPRNAAFYGKNHPNFGDRLASTTLARFALNKIIEEDIDFSKYDSDGDNVIDGLIIIYAGKGENQKNSLGSSAIWPHYSTFSDLSKSPYASFKDQNGKMWKIDKYILVPQDASIDLYTHEFGHFLGLTDLYDPSAAIGYWSSMAHIYCGHDMVGSKLNSIGGYHRDNMMQLAQANGYKALWAKTVEKDLKEIKKNKTTIDLFESNKKSYDNLLKVELDERIIKLPDTKSKIYYSSNIIGSESRFIIDTVLPDTSHNIFSLNALYYSISDRSKMKVYAREKGTLMWEELEYIVPRGFIPKDLKWFHVFFDLDKFRGKEIQIKGKVIPSLNKWKKGIFVSKMMIFSNGEIIYNTNKDPITLDGFTLSDGRLALKRYLLFEYRNPQKGQIDEGLLETPLGIPYPKSLIVWYINEGYSKGENLVSLLPLNIGNIYKVDNGRVDEFNDKRYLVSSYGASLSGVEEKKAFLDDFILFHEKVDGKKINNLIDGLKLEILSESNSKISFNLFHETKD